MNNNGLKGKLALVTGGTGGIGSAICQVLAQQGVQIVTTYQNKEKAEVWQKEMLAKGYVVGVFPCDVGSFTSCQDLAKQVTTQHGQVQLLINNAGITRDGSFRKMSFEQWEQVIQTNLASAFAVTKAFLDGMLEAKFGRIVNISSVNGRKGQFGQVNYSAAKAGLHGFTMALAQEVASKGITVNTVSPGYIATDMVKAIKPEVLEKIVSTIPVGRLGETMEIAELVAYLCQPYSGFITGANIDINGGQFIH